MRREIFLVDYFGNKISVVGDYETSEEEGSDSFWLEDFNLVDESGYHETDMYTKEGIRDAAYYALQGNHEEVQLTEKETDMVLSEKYLLIRESKLLGELIMKKVNESNDKKVIGKLLDICKKLEKIGFLDDYSEDCLIAYRTKY